MSVDLELELAGVVCAIRDRLAAIPVGRRTIPLPVRFKPSLVAELDAVRIECGAVFRVVDVGVAHFHLSRVA